MVTRLQDGSRSKRIDLHTTMCDTRLPSTVYHEEWDPTLMALLGLIIHAK